MFWRGSVSPDGTRFAFVASYLESTTDVLGVDGEDGAVVISDDDAEPLTFGWMPASDELLVADAAPWDALEGPPERVRLYVVDLDGELVHEVPLTDDLLFDGGLTIDPTGSYVVASALTRSSDDAQWDLVKVWLESGEVENLTNTPTKDERSPWLLDDGTIVFTDPNIRAMGPDRTIRGLTDSNVIGDYTSARPDLGVVFDGRVQQPDGQWRGGIWRLPLEGGEPEFLVGGYSSPVVHPTRSGFVAIRVADPGQPSPYVYLDIDGGTDVATTYRG